MIDHHHKFIFVHIPKCGGCSIAKILNTLPPIVDNTGHRTLKQIFLMHPGCENYFKFTFVRNPWDRCVSLYNFWRQQSYDHPWTYHDKRQMDFCKNHSFLNFLKNLNSPELDRVHTKPYFTHYFSSEQRYNFVGRLENLQADFNTVCNKIGIKEQELPHENKSKHKHYTEYYDKESRKIVADTFAQDIEYFKYKF